MAVSKEQQEIINKMKKAHQKRNIVNADTMYVYVPSGSVEFQGSVMVK